MAWIIDLDGVMWRGAEPIPGSAEACAALVAAGVDVGYATNNASFRIADHEDKLARFGVEAAGRVVSAAQAGAALLDPGWRVLVVGGPGLVEQVTLRGCEIVTGGPADAVICGLDRDLTYAKLTEAALAIRAGARWILTNHDPTFPTERGLEPGAGSIAALLAAATDAEPVVAGKPNEAMVRLVRDRFGTEGVVVGDRPDTDGEFARALGYRFALVLTGVVSADDLPVTPEPDFVADDLASFVASMVEARRA